MYLYFDQFNGELVYKWDRSGQSAGDSVMSWLGYLHVGSFGGMPIKILWVILGMTPALLFVTGSLMWWNRVLSEKWAKLQGEPAKRVNAADLLAE